MENINADIKKKSEYSIKELRGLCQATAPNPAMETYIGKVSRVFSIYTTRYFLHTSITPNQITVIGTAFFFISTLFYFGDYRITLLGPLFYFLSIVIDGADGEVARFRNIKSKFGGPYVEPVSHDIQYGLFFPILATALFYNGASPYIFLAAGVASITKLLYRLLQIRFWNSFYEDKNFKGKDIQNAVYQNRHPLVKFFYFSSSNIFSYTGIFSILLIATALNVIGELIWFYAIGFSLLYMALLAKQVMIIARG